MPISSPTKEMLEGTKAHEVAADMLQAYINHTPYEPSNGLEPELVGACRLYLDHIKAICSTDPLVEAKIKIADDCWGYCDFACVNETTLHVFDFKYGKGIDVLPAHNPQLLLYAYGLAKSYPHVETVYLVISQPRLNNEPKTVAYPVEEIFRMASEILAKGQRAVEELKAGLPSLSPGSHCRFCSARAVCSSHVQQLENASSLSLVENIPLPNINTLSDEKLARLIAAKAEIEKYLDAVEDHCLLRHENGNPVTGTKAVRGSGIRQWRDANVGEELAKLGVAEPYTKKLIGVTEAQRLVGKEIVDSLTIQSMGRVHIVLESDKRPALPVPRPEILE